MRRSHCDFTVRGAGGPAKAVVGLAAIIFIIALGARILRRRHPAPGDAAEGTPAA